MSTWNVTIDFGGGAVDITNDVLHQSFRRTRFIHKRLKPTTNDCTFLIEGDSAVFSSLLAAGDETVVTITKDGSPYFKGYLNRNYSIPVEAAQNGPITLKVEDWGKHRLDKKIEVNARYNNHKVVDVANQSASIIHKLLSEAGFSAGEINLTADIDKTITEFILFSEDDDTYWDRIQELLFEFGYVFYIDEQGRFSVYNLFPSSTATANKFENTASSKNILKQVVIGRSKERYDDARVKWYPLSTLSDVKVYEDTTGGTDTQRASISVNAGEYYPDEGNTRQIFQKYKVDDADVVSVINTSVVESSGSNISYTFTNYFVQGKVLFQNTGGSVQQITKFEIWGDAIIRGDTINIVRAEITPGSEHYYDFESKYIESNTDAEYLATGLGRYYKYSSTTFTLESKTAYDIGDFVVVDEDRNNINQACLIVGRQDKIYNNSSSGLEERFIYSLEAVEPFTASSTILTASAGPTPNSAARTPTYVEITEGFSTATPDAPTNLSAEANFRDISVRWQSAIDAVNFSKFRVQVSADEVNWYALGFDGTDWKSGSADGYTEHTATTITHTRIPNVDSGSSISGRTLYYRVAVVNKAGNVSSYSSSVSATTYPIEDADVGDDAIKTQHIIADAITNDQVATDAISTDSIQDDAVTPLQMLAKDPSNICPNPVFEGGSSAGWGSVNVVASTDAGVPSGAPTNYVARQNERDELGNFWFDVEEGQQYYVEYYAATPDSAYPFRMGLQLVDNDIAGSIWIEVNPLNPTSTWTKRSGFVTVPTGRTKAKIWASISTFTNYGNWYWSKVVVRKASDRDLIPPSAVGDTEIDFNYALSTSKGGSATNTDAVDGIPSSYISSFVSVETWDDENALAAWDVVASGSGERSIVASSDAQTGGHFLRVGNNSGDDTRWNMWKKSIPFDPSKLYRFRIRVRQTAGSGTFYAGVIGRNYDDTAYVSSIGTNTPTSAHYIAAAGETLSSSWVEYTGYFKGFAPGNGSSKSPSPDSPGKLHADVRYFRPMFISNYQAVAGITEIDYISVEIIPENLTELPNGQMVYDWKYPTSVNIDGGNIEAATVTAGAINVSLLSNISTDLGTIDGGTLESSTNNFWNLDTGEFKVGNAAGTKYFYFDTNNIYFKSVDIELNTADLTTFLDSNQEERLQHKQVNLSWDDWNGSSWDNKADLYYDFDNSRLALSVDGGSTDLMRWEDGAITSVGHNRYTSGYSTSYRSSTSIRITNPGGGEYVSTSSNRVGAFKIKIPDAAAGDNMMISMKLTLFDYSAYESCEIFLAGYTYNPGDNWINPTAYIVGRSTSRFVPIRFGGLNDAGGNRIEWYIYIGDLDSDWDYPSLKIQEVNVHFSGYSADKLEEGWSITLEDTSFDDIDVAVTYNSQAPWYSNTTKSYTTNDVGIGGAPNTDVELHIQSSIPKIRLSDTDATTDTEVAAYLEFYRGASTHRNGFIGYGSGNNQHLYISNENVAAILFQVQGETAGYFDAAKDLYLNGNISMVANKSIYYDDGAGSRAEIVLRENPIQSKSGGSGAPYNSGLFISADGQIVFGETDADAVRGWMDVNNNHFYWSGTATFDGDVDFTDGLHAGNTHIDGGFIELTSGATGARNSYIDFHNADSPSDYTARIIHPSGTTYLQFIATAGGVFRFTTDSGYVAIGPQNTSYAHFSTDRAAYYFNKGVTVDTGIISSYDEDLTLQRAGTTKLELGNTLSKFYGNDVEIEGSLEISEADADRRFILKTNNGWDASMVFGEGSGIEHGIGFNYNATNNTLKFGSWDAKDYTTNPDAPSHTYFTVTRNSAIITFYNLKIGSSGSNITQMRVV